jgi:hypothetical protein
VSTDETVPSQQTESAPPVHEPAGPSAATPAAAPETTPSSQDPGDLTVLGRLESELAAVEAAMDSLVAIAAAPERGDGAAAQIRAVVNAERFPLPDEDRPAPEPSPAQQDRPTWGGPTSSD